MVKKTALILGLFLLVAATVLIVSVYRYLYQPLSFTSTIEYSLKPGTSMRRLAGQLQEKKIIDCPLYFEWYARITGLDQKIQAGEYTLQPGLSAVEILALMHRGEVRQYSFTVIEGWTFKQLRAALANAEAIEHRLPADAGDAEVMTILGYAGQHPEGRFYPDTYLFPRGMSDIDFLKRAYKEMAVILEREWQQRDSGLPLKSKYEALILASIVERESALAEERPLIASVFVNRLKKGMRLQTDPTVIYGMGDDYDGDIRFRDLRRDTPYNTYTRSGLPPTPIAMPSAAAIHASLHPTESSVLYFVAKGKPDGSHHFSETLSEHNAAVDRYQRKRKPIK